MVKKYTVHLHIAYYKSRVHPQLLTQCSRVHLFFQNLLIQKTIQNPRMHCVCLLQKYHWQVIYRYCPFKSLITYRFVRRIYCLVGKPNRPSSVASCHCLTSLKYAKKLHFHTVVYNIRLFSNLPCKGPVSRDGRLWKWFSYLLNNYIGTKLYHRT